MTWGSNIGFRYAVLSAFITWLPVESIQWLVLSQRLGWQVSFMLEIGFGILAGLLLGTLIGEILFGFPGQLALSLGGAIVGSAVSKWLILRQRVRSSFWWLIANVVSIPLSLGISRITVSVVNFVLRSFSSNLSSGLRFNLSVAIAMAVGIGIYSIIAGIVLMWLSKRHVSE